LAFGSTLEATLSRSVSTDSPDTRRAAAESTLSVVRSESIVLRSRVIESTLSLVSMTPLVRWTMLAVAL
jgi:hypothetical protein